MNKKIIIGILIALVALTTFVSALPSGPKTIVRSNDERWPLWAPLTQEALAEHNKEISGSKIAVLGVAFLENSDDTRNTPTTRHAS